MRRGIMKLRKLKVRCYAASIIGLIEYLAAFPVENISDKIGEM